MSTDTELDTIRALFDAIQEASERGKGVMKGGRIAAMRNDDCFEPW